MMYAYEGELTPTKVGLLVYRFVNQGFDDPLAPAEWIFEVCGWLQQNAPEAAREECDTIDRLRIEKTCEVQHRPGSVPVTDQAVQDAAGVARRASNVVIWLIQNGTSIPRPGECKHGEVLLWHPDPATSRSSARTARAWCGPATCTTMRVLSAGAPSRPR